MEELHGAAQTLSSSSGNPPLEVPAELLSYIDDGGNPDVFLSDSVKAAVESNQAVCGKVKAFIEFRNKLMHKMESNGYGDVIQAYKLARGEEIAREKK